MNFRSAWRYLRLAPFDTSTEQGRQDERYRLAALSIVANLASRAAGVAVMVLSVSLTIPYLGAERFGVWMTIASFVGLLSFLDLGVGNALTNHVAQKAAIEQPEVISQAVSGGLGFLALIGTFMAIVLWLLAANLPWAALISVKQPDVLLEARQAAMLFAIFFGLHIFTNGVHRVFAGLQQAYFSHLASIAGALVACVGLLIASETRQGIPVLLGITFGSQCIAGLILVIILVLRAQLKLKGIFGFSKIAGVNLFRAGGLFFLLQIGTMVGSGADSLIVASALGAEQVAILSIVQRLFSFATQPLSVLNAPLWGAYADAAARNDKKFIRETLKRSIYTTIGVSTAISIVLFLCHSWIIQRWTNSEILVPLLFVTAYAVWTIIDCVGNSFAMFLNGVNVVRQQVVVVLFFVLLALPSKLILIKYFDLAAIPLATIFAYTISTIGLYGLFFMRDIREKIQ